MAAAYLLAQSTFRLIVMTLATYVVTNTGENLPKVADFIDSNTLPIHSLAAFLFVLAMHFMNPIVGTNLHSVFKVELSRETTVSHIFRGLVLGSVLIVGGLLAGQFTWLGFYVRFDEVVVSFGSALIFAAGIMSLVTFEEYLMRSVLEPQFRGSGSPTLILAGSTALFVGMKGLQFDLTNVEAFNFALLNIVFSGIARRDRSHTASAIFASAFLFTVHTVFGLPFLGQDMPGIFLLRAQQNATMTLGTALSGGPRGPENSILLTVLLSVWIALPFLQRKLREREIEFR